MALSYYEQLKHPLWIKKVDEILKLHDYKCAICGSLYHKLEVHHLCYFPDLLIWEYENELLIPVCKKHHYELTYEMPKVSGLIAFNCLKSNIDLNDVINVLKSLNKFNNGKR